MKNQYLLFIVFYENLYLSLEKDKSTSQSEILSFPLYTQKSYTSHAFAGDRNNLFACRMIISQWTLICFDLYLQPWDKPSNDIFSAFRQTPMARLIFLV